MSREPRVFQNSRTAFEWIVASCVVAVAIALAAFGVWVFRPASDAALRSIARAILSDRTTLGFVRLLVTAVALYGVASIAVLVMRGRWMRSISTTGIEAEASEYSDRAIDTLKQDLRRARSELVEAKRLMAGLPDG